MKRRKFIQTMAAGAAGILLGGCGFKLPFTESLAEDASSGSTNLPDFTGSIQYRILPQTGEKVSSIGLGTGVLHESPPKEIERIIAYASEQGINLMDTMMSDFTPAESIARALKGRRDKMLTQMHIGVIYPSGRYTRTRDLKEVQRGFAQQLKAFDTDYSDIGLLHYVDEAADFENILANGIFDFAKKLKQAGTIRYLGFSSHSVATCRRFLETGEIDIFMLSANAAYDFEPSGGKLHISEERRQLYQESQKRGVVITVMKPYGGGRLLSDAASPFGRAMSVPQCIQYALDRPGVAACLPGIRKMTDLTDVLAYYKASREERDYSFIGSAHRQDMEGICIYCSHCQPCSYGIDVATVNKYLDFAKAGDALAKDHYFKLRRTARDCTSCGECMPRCPFHVDILKRMREANEFFGR